MKHHSVNRMDNIHDLFVVQISVMKNVPFDFVIINKMASVLRVERIILKLAMLTCGAHCESLIKAKRALDP